MFQTVLLYAQVMLNNGTPPCDVYRTTYESTINYGICVPNNEDEDLSCTAEGDYLLDYLFVLCHPGVCSFDEGAGRLNCLDPNWTNGE